MGRPAEGLARLQAGPLLGRFSAPSETRFERSGRVGGLWKQGCPAWIRL